MGSVSRTVRPKAWRGVVPGEFVGWWEGWKSWYFRPRRRREEMNSGRWVARWARRGEEGLRGVSPPGRYRSAGGQREEGWIGVKKGEGCWWGEVG